MNDLSLILSKIAYVCFFKNHQKEAQDKTMVVLNLWLAKIWKQMILDLYFYIFAILWDCQDIETYELRSIFLHLRSDVHGRTSAKIQPQSIISREEMESSEWCS